MKSWRPWNPWHGCKKFSPGCQNCYVYRMDKMFGRDSSHFSLTGAYLMPGEKVKRGPNKGSYKFQSVDPVYTCFTSDFFLEDADRYREILWNIIKIRKDLHFYIPTKRIHRFIDCVPHDWNDGYENVTIACTTENQSVADTRLSLFASLPIKHKEIIVEPMLEAMDISPYLSGIKHVTAGGESGPGARPCNLKWFIDLQHQCKAARVSFWFKQTGARFINENGTLVKVARKNQYDFADKYQLSIE